MASATHHDDLARAITDAYPRLPNRLQAIARYALGNPDAMALSTGTPFSPLPATIRADPLARSSAWIRRRSAMKSLRPEESSVMQYGPLRRACAAGTP